jgi:hypothetical protein
MRKTLFYLILLLSISYLTSCTPYIKHADTFYNVNDGIDPRRIPLIKPIDVIHLNSSSLWDLDLLPSMWIDYPKSQGLYYLYGYVHELEKFAVNNGIIMAYSSYVDEEADAYIQENYYHWFVLIPDKEITKGFHTEDEFNEYTQSLGVEEPDWQTPDKAHKQFRKTGCLEWIPDCK